MLNIRFHALYTTKKSIILRLKFESYITILPQRKNFSMDLETSGHTSFSF